MADNIDGSLENFDELIKTNPEAAYRLMERISKSKLYEALHLEDLQGLLDEVTRVGFDAKDLQKAFQQYTRIDCEYTEEYKLVFADLKTGCERKINSFLAHIERTRRRETEMGFSSGNYVFENEAVHLAYLGVVEERIASVLDHSQNLQELITELGESDIDLKDDLENQRASREAGVPPQEGSYKLSLQRALDDNNQLSLRLLTYSEQLVMDCKRRNYKFTVPRLFRL